MVYALVTPLWSVFERATLHAYFNIATFKRLPLTKRPLLGRYQVRAGNLAVVGKESHVADGSRDVGSQLNGPRTVCLLVWSFRGGLDMALVVCGAKETLNLGSSINF